MKHRSVRARLALVGWLACTSVWSSEVNAESTDYFVPSVVRSNPRLAVAKVLQLARLKKHEEALREAQAHLKSASSLSKPPLLWLAASSAARLPSPERRAEAAGYYEALGALSHPLSPWARLRRAQILLASDAPTELAQAAAVAATLMHEWAGQDEARQLEAIALSRMDPQDPSNPHNPHNPHNEGIEKLRALLQHTHSGARPQPELQMALADALARSQDASLRQQALELYRGVSARGPLSATGKEATRKWLALVAQLPAAEQAAQREYTVQEAFDHADALVSGLQFAQAQKEFQALSLRLAGDLPRRCESESKRGQAMAKQRARRDAAEVFSQVVMQCLDPEIRARAWFSAGRAYGAVDDHQAAIQHYDMLVQEFPQHRLTDDALYRSALQYRAQGDLDNMRKKLEQMRDSTPQGDMVAEGTFTLAWYYRSLGAHEKALEFFEELSRSSHSTDETQVGRAAYWRARTLSALGRAAEARAAYEALLREVPLTYYAALSLARLQELDPAASKQARAWLRAQRPAETPLRWSRMPEMSGASFQAAIELLKVSETALALKELRYGGLLDRATSNPEFGWALAAVLHEAGAYEAGLRIARKLHRPKNWRVLYPTAYQPLIESVAKKSGVASAYIRATAREESSFDAEAVSWANAHGLIQLIPKTACSNAKELKLPCDPESLHQPAINLAIGARFMRFLWDRYQANPAVVPAAYNAGHGAADKWLQERAGQPLDEWIEEIPYDETRRYTRKVLQSYGVYHWLETGELPALRLSLEASGRAL